MVKTADLLVLKYGELNRDSANLFAELNESKALRKLFFANPSLVLRSRLQSVTGIDGAVQLDEQANRVLFSVLSNKRFMDFLNSYQAGKSAALERFLANPKDREAVAALDEKTIRLEFAEAILKYGDRELVANLITRGRPGSQGGAMGWWAILVVVVVVVAVIHAVVELGTSGDSVAANARRLTLSAADLKKMSKQLISTADEVRASGELA